ncbi:MAG: macrolide ABC transporter ATP-binding protein [Cohnella sp.]|uniref:ABC transporter ATP-binding protein n=1 Tax=Cohnella sp. TaxID=1883426 RepID=UPI000E393947|nr:ABC transporter ATP-binding protein [Cohnella sp.]REK68164.1 MAG: macrolide ABC transporter ATP-binding protein [Cohnella sp.]
MAFIQLNRVSRFYRAGGKVVKALDNVSLSIQKGEFVAIAGPSGSGKSTLMNILGCLDVPDEGTYVLDGVNVATLSPGKLAEIRNRSIGFVFQQFNLLPRLTAFANVELPLIYRGLDSQTRKQAVLRTLAAVGLADRKAHRPAELSGGQQQRVAIARALAADPPLLLADEPTGSLDRKAAEDILELLRRLNEQGRTVVLITHDPGVARWARRIVVLEDGKIAPADSGTRLA